MTIPLTNSLFPSAHVLVSMVIRTLSLASNILAYSFPTGLSDCYSQVYIRICLWMLDLGERLTHSLTLGVRLFTMGKDKFSFPCFFHLTSACPNITPRSVWEARETHCPQMNLPVKYVIIIHTAGTSCSVPVDCQIRVRDTQSFHVDRRDFCDIGYQ
jgi:hypothetical protein